MATQLLQVQTQTGYAEPRVRSKDRSTSRGKRRNRERSHLVVNTSDCVGKSAKDLFSAVAATLEWQEVDVEPKTCSSTSANPTKKASTIFCLMNQVDLVKRFPELGARSWVSRYLGAPDMCDKGNLARAIRACEGLCEDPAYFAFNPATWVLPDQYEDLRQVLQKSDSTFIVKPDDGSQGDGIFLVRGVRDLDVKLSVQNGACRAVVQEYISKPALLEGLKFDLRMYVSVIGGSDTTPPQVWLCREGLARFCTENYVQPSQQNMHKCMSHLTNYSLNKRSKNFQHCSQSIDEVFSEQNKASKRPLTVALRQLALEFPDFDVEDFYKSVMDMVQKTMILMTPVLRSQYRSAGHAAKGMPCFQVLGFDVILDSKFQPYLLEVNNSPSLCIDEALPLDQGEGSTKHCRCMDMAEPHYHQTALVDLQVKTVAMKGAFQLLEALSQGVESPSADSYMALEVDDGDLYPRLSSVEALYHQLGGASKAFTSSGLRRGLGALCGTGGLQKHDLDTLSQRCRVTNYVTHDRTMRGPDHLRLFDFLDAVRNAGSRAFPGSPPKEVVDRALSVVLRSQA